MQITQESFLDFLGKPNTRFAIPVFQRVYSWNTRQCEELWDDIVHAGTAGADHFMGLVLYSADADKSAGAELLDVIDGQQRMTTITLAITALCTVLDQADATVAGLGVDDIRDRYLVTVAGDTPDGQANELGKLVLSQMDRDTLFALVGAGEPPESPAQRLIDNCQLFIDKMSDGTYDLEAVWRGLNSLHVADVLLEADDSPQLVFESLNSKGMPLSTADRVRNYLIASSTGDEQDILYEQRWLPLEETTANASEPADLADVLNAWLAETYRGTQIFDQSEVYGLFKARLKGDYANSLEALLADVATYCDRYLADDEFRKEAEADTAAWLAGKPKHSISEYKMFGD